MNNTEPEFAVLVTSAPWHLLALFWVTAIGFFVALWAIWYAVRHRRDNAKRRRPIRVLTFLAVLVLLVGLVNLLNTIADGLLTSITDTSMDLVVLALCLHQPIKLFTIPLGFSGVLILIALTMPWARTYKQTQDSPTRD